MTQFSCVGLHSNEAWGLCGLTAGAQGLSRASDVTQSTAQTLWSGFTIKCTELNVSVQFLLLLLRPVSSVFGRSN